MPFSKNPTNKRLDVAILTEDRYLKPNPYDWYTSQIIYEESFLLQRFKERKIVAERVSWSDPTIDWSEVKFALFRTTWDYFDRLTEFMAWLEATSAKTTFIHSLEVIRWNLDKRYLIELASRGISTVPTFYVEPSDPRTLSELAAGIGENIVVKPVISGNAKDTFHLPSAEEIRDFGVIFADLNSDQGMLMQPFQDSIKTNGEISVMVIANQITHAIRKIAKAGDFRVQDDYGGRVVQHTISEEEHLFVENMIARIGRDLLYARIDLVRNNDQQLAVMEVEAIEPELFFRFCPPSATALADAIVDRYLAVGEGKLGADSE